MIAEVFADFQAVIGPENCAFVGPKQADETAAPPRISWCPIGAKQLAPRRTNGRAGDDGPILTRQWMVQIDIWGTDLGNAEKLADLFLGVAHDKLSQYSYQPGEETWKVTGQTGAGATCSMLLYIQAPILRLPIPVVTLAEIRATFRLPTNADVISNLTKP